MLTLTGTLARTNAYYGQGSGLIMVTNVGCAGEEQSLLNCTHTGYGVTSCRHYEDAGVRCPGIFTCYIVLRLPNNAIPMKPCK